MNQYMMYIVDENRYDESDDESSMAQQAFDEI